MENKAEKRNARPMEFPPLPLWADGNFGYFDPLGSYTGRTDNPDEKPVQDADDL